MSVRVQERPGRVAPTRAGVRDARGWGVIAGPAVLAAVLSLIGLSGRSLGFDEGATASIAAQHGAALWRAIAHDGGNMSAYYLLVHVLIGVFGNGVVLLRLPSVIATVATAALIAVIAERLFTDRRVTAAAGVLAAVSLPLIYWGQTARGYALMVAFVCAAMVAFIDLVDTGSGAAGGARAAAAAASARRGPWLGFVAAMTLAMYCSFVAALVIPAQVLAVLARRGAARRYASALVAAAILCVPLAVLAVRRGSGQLFWVQPPSRMVDTQVLQSLTSAGLQPVFHHSFTTKAVMWVTLAAVVGLVADTVARRRRGEPVWGMGLVLSWCVLPGALTFLYSVISHPVLVPRNVLMSTPAVGLALAPALGRRRWPRSLAPALLVVVLAARAIPVVHASGVSPEPWQAVTARVLAESRPGDCVTFYPADARMAFQYYVGTGAATRRAPRAVLPVIAWGVVRPFVEDYAVPSPATLAGRTAGCQRMWLVSSHEGQRNGPPQARANRARWFRLAGELERRFGSGPVAKYGYASIIHVQLMPGAQGRSVKP
ncbi:MAG TPA: glycosyltransferase family 39 protein [Solirubrobacteraceae bacterium]|nr:glycosyltransferase family 39 protein [Solirubrobacteraceae bacterium]